MNATRNKRWSGNVDALPSEYLKSVMEKMADYGDRVQFSLMSGPLPAYQVINTFDKKMAFDSNHHVMRAQEHEFVDANAGPLCTLAQLQALIAGERIGKEAKAKDKTVRVVRPGGGTRTTTAQLHDQFAAQRYEYFKNNRQSLPPTITEHTQEITELMKQGKSVEEAFGEVVAKYY